MPVYFARIGGPSLSMTHQRISQNPIFAVNQKVFYLRDQQQ